MKPNTYDEMIEVIQALKAGKRVEVYLGNAWRAMHSSHPDFQMHTYRVAREPIRMWVVLTPGGSVNDSYSFKENADRVAKAIRGTVIELAEVQK